MCTLVQGGGREAPADSRPGGRRYILAVAV